MIFDDDTVSLVLDNGGDKIKIGFAGDDSPRGVFPSVIGFSKIKRTMVNEGAKASYIGDEATSKLNELTLKYPIQHGIITDWDDIEKIWHHAFYNELRVSPKEHPVLLTEALLNPKKNREKMAEIMFEKFDVPALSIEISNLLALYASGRTTGTVFECGDGVTSALSIYEGHLITESVIRYDYGGDDINKYLMKLLNKNGYSFSKSNLNEVENIKKKLCYVALDYEAQVKAAGSSTVLNETYKLPDDQVVNVGSEKFQCAEAFFDPSLISLSASGVHDVVYKSIENSDTDTRKDLFGNIVVAGGSTLLSGFRERLNKELTALAKNIEKVRVIAPPERIASTWIGGSILASLSSFQSKWKSKSDYLEHGSNIVNENHVSV